VKARLRSDEGSTLVLTIFYAGLSLIVVLLVVSASSLYLERSRLYAVADGAALAGAESFGLGSIEVSESQVAPRLDDAQITAAVDGYLAATPSSDEFSELGVEQAGTADGRSATVTLSAVWHPVLVSILVPGGFRIEVTSVARSVFS
jgi:uncharacterized membrane protein